MSERQKEGLQRVGLILTGAGVAVTLLLAARSYAELPERVTKVEVKVEGLSRENAEMRAELGERLARIEALMISLKDSLEDHKRSQPPK